MNRPVLVSSTETRPVHSVLLLVLLAVLLAVLLKRTGKWTLGCELVFLNP